MQTARFHLCPKTNISQEYTMAQCETFILRLSLSRDDDGKSLLIRLQSVKSGSHRCMANLASLEKALQAWHRENRKTLSPKSKTKKRKRSKKK